VDGSRLLLSFAYSAYLGIGPCLVEALQANVVPLSCEVKLLKADHQECQPRCALNFPSVADSNWDLLAKAFAIISSVHTKRLLPSNTICLLAGKQEAGDLVLLLASTPLWTASARLRVPAYTALTNVRRYSATVA